MAKGDNECIPLYDAGDDVPVHAEAAVTGCRFLAISDPQQGPVLAGLSPTSEGSNIVVSHCGAGAKAFGVSSYDSPAGDKLYAIRGNKLVPVLAGAAITAGQQVESDANGKAIPLNTGKANGMAVDDIANGAVGFIAITV